MPLTQVSCSTFQESSASDTQPCIPPKNWRRSVMCKPLICNIKSTHLHLQPLFCIKTGLQFKD